MTTTERNLERLAYNTKGIIRDLEELLKGVPEDLTDEAQKIRHRLEGTLQSAKESCQRLEHRTRAGIRATDEALREKPYPFLGAAFGLGLLMGLLTCRR